MMKTQKQISEKSLKETDATELWPNSIVTEIAPYQKFYKAEEQHQQYFDRVGARKPILHLYHRSKIGKV